MYELMNGKEVAEKIKLQVKDEIAALGLDPTLAVIVVGNDPASKIYVNNKKKACEQVGIESLECYFKEDATEAELINFIDELNESPCVSGILVQLPLPEHLNAKKILEHIDPAKDVDCFTSINTGKLWLGEYELAPCTAMGIIELLDYYNIDIAGKHCVVVGRSNIVGKPVAALMLERNATVTICHSKTQNLSDVTRKADILISAVGKPKFITWGMVKDGAVVVDVGINRDEDGKLCGDIDFKGVSDRASYLTPVPGGVGPMTVAMLMKNTLIAAKNLQ
ncbi:MAG: bifunctional methylenetetrahydrofolate dehydrogenase/methenyltetrahydrofolate cyclohydrolase FolD [Kiritimatiellae bacterium]|nr:bifunctional methylenetetrahydrofolate dehydrogenase/methenyltetrahydrofolate cyclohydrolase FolD [Kiritimatiellia bacterium]